MRGLVFDDSFSVAFGSLEEFTEFVIIPVFYSESEGLHNHNKPDNSSHIEPVRLWGVLSIDVNFGRECAAHQQSYKEQSPSFLDHLVLLIITC